MFRIAHCIAHPQYRIAHCIARRIVAHRDTRVVAARYIPADRMRRGVLFVTIAAASWGTWSLFLRPTGLSWRITSPLVFLIIGIVLVPFAWREPRPVWDRRSIGVMLLNAFSDATNLITFFAAMQMTTDRHGPMWTRLLEKDGRKAPGTEPRSAEPATQLKRKES